jgi:spore protease
VPTVVDAVAIVSDTIEFLTKHYAYIKKNAKAHHKKSKDTENYLKENINVSIQDRENLLGLIGTLSEEEIRILIKDVLTPIGYNLMVTPKEIDFTISELSTILAKSLNKILHH